MGWIGRQVHPADIVAIETDNESGFRNVPSYLVQVSSTYGTNYL